MSGSESVTPAHDVLVSVHAPILRSGRAVRTYGVARALAAAGGGVTLVYVRFGGEGPDAAYRAIPGIAFEAVEPSRGLRRLLAYGAARLRGVPDDFARGVSPELVAAVRRLAPSDTTRVIADGPTEAAALAGLARHRPVIYNAHNLESAYRHELEASSGLGSPEQLRRFERGVLARAAESWMVSEADAAAARELCADARLRLVPNVVDVAAIAPVTPDVAACRALFVGNFSYEPNRNGLRFLLDDVMPRVWAQLPEARLRLVGAGLDEPPSDDPRVEALGFVDDLADAYAGVSAVVVPLLQGGGTPLKFVEGLAYGVPVVATPRAAAGLAVRDGQDCLLAEGGDAYAEALTRALRDGVPGLGERARALAAERYSIEALTRLVAS
ncbi:MAG TPA: glycosyltransferase family 4 protein [Conexibacter sp.]|nr:glycosyltransferase family 4 protein [Conexibacter sp.]